MVNFHLQEQDCEKAAPITLKTFPLFSSSLSNDHWTGSLLLLPPIDSPTIWSGLWDDWIIWSVACKWMTRAVGGGETGNIKSTCHDFWTWWCIWWPHNRPFANISSMVVMYPCHRLWTSCLRKKVRGLVSVRISKRRWESKLKWILRKIGFISLWLRGYLMIIFVYLLLLLCFNDFSKFKSWNS